jgi:hypothetical protein
MSAGATPSSWRESPPPFGELLLIGIAWNLAMLKMLNVYCFFSSSILNIELLKI